MYMRLGFAVAIHVDPDVLLVDEVLAVGDEGFTHKCLDKFAEFKRRGKTILLVTHSLGLVERFCDEALWLDAGRVKGSGDPKRIVGAYVTDVERRRSASLPRPTRAPRASAAARHRVARRTGRGRPARHADRNGDRPGRHVSRDGRPLGIARSRNHRRRDPGRARGRARATFSNPATRLDVTIRLRAPLPIDDFVVGVGLFNAEGVCCYGTNTSIEELPPERLQRRG